ncbi:AAA family ATPase [Dongia mobilis]|uniref:AAA family ATPase n=1 Tax=Dongia mobilis TaxID=578943 RepID=UPI0014152371|nr:AAA family ATPase [Dongia mobilis]
MNQAGSDSQPRLRLLGEIALFRDGAYLALPPSKKTRALLAYLAATARPHRRERLCSLFWDIPDDPRGALRWSLSRLRPLLDSENATRIIADRDNVALAVDSLSVDFHEFGRVLARPEASPTELAAAADLVEGEFAEGLELGACADFQLWLTTQREAVRRQHLDLLQRVVATLPPEAALPYAQRRLSLDPDAEAHHADLLRLLLAAGRRREAEKQFELSLARLRESGAEPVDSLTLFWRQALAAGPAAPITSRAEVGVAAVDRAAPAQAGPAPPAEWSEERKQVSVLHVNLRDAPLTDDPEIVAARMAPLMDCMTSAIERYGGHVTQRRQEGLTALFGAPVACQNHTMRACLAALAMREGTGDASLAIAIHAGEILVRSNGPAVEAFGPPLKIAQEIERMTPPHGISLSRQAYQLVDGMLQAEAGGALALPGLAEPLELLLLSGEAAMAGAWYARTIRGLSAFVGRQPELSALVRIAQRAASGTGQVAVIVGEPGLGKSRLLHELVQQGEIAQGGWRRIEGAATPYDQDTAYFLVGRLLRHWLQVDRRLPAADLRRRLEAAIAALDPALLWAAPALGIPLDLPVDATWHSLDAGQRRRQVIDAVDAVLAALAAQQPLLLVIEDLHWADADSAAIIENTVNRLARRRIAICVTTRPEGAPGWIAKSTCHPLRLMALDAAAAEAMADALLGDDTSLADLKRRLIERTAGTPLFLEEAINALVESGSLLGQRGAYRLTGGQAELRLPATVQAVLGERIDRLPRHLKLLLQVAAVIGDDVPLNVLLPLMELPPADLDAQLDALQDAEFLFETQPAPNRRFSFKHALTRDVAYASLLVAQRRRLHQRVLKIMLRRLRPRGDELVERLAHHAVNGERWALAVKFLRQAGDKCFRRSAYRESVRFYEAALKALENLPDAAAAQKFSATLRLRLRPPLGAIAAFGQAFAHLDVAERIVAARGDLPRMISIAIHKSYILSSQGRIEDAISAAERARSLAAGTEDQLAQLEARLAHSQALAFRGDVAGALELASPIRQRLVTELRHERLGQTGLRSVWCLMHLADALTLKGDLNAARAVTAEAIAIAEEVNKPYDRAVAHLREGFIEIQDANPQRAVAAFDRSRALAEGSDLGWVAAWARTGLGYAYFLSGHAEAGTHLLEATKRQAVAAEFVAVEAMSSVFLADTRRRAGQWRDAENEARSALEGARHWGYWDIEVMALICLGRVALDRRDDAAVALRHLREAAQLAESRSYRLMLAEINQLMAPVLDGIGEREAAAAATLLADRLLRELR